MNKVDVLRRYRDVHRDEVDYGDLSPLHRLRQAVAGKDEVGKHTVDEDDIRQLARDVALPEATVRGALSFYSDLHEKESDVIVCTGTSCQLAGADNLHTQLAQNQSCRTAYCLGYCDRSPAILTPEKAIYSGGDARQFAAGTTPTATTSESDIRCLGTEPLVTRRIGRGDFSQLEIARADGAYRALEMALAQSPVDVLREVERSGERGRGEAAFSTGVKWRSCADAPGTLFLSFHFPETHTNLLIGPHLDPESKRPQYKTTAVRLQTFQRE